MFQANNYDLNKKIKPPTNKSVKNKNTEFA